MKKALSEIMLVEPSIIHQTAAEEFVQEFYRCDPDFHGFGRLEEYQDYGQWLERLEMDKKAESCGPDRVPGETLFAWDTENKRIIATVNIRYYLNDYLEKFGGHIGLSVRPSERNKGYGTLVLAKALERCKNLNIKKVLITCKSNNKGSAKMIVNNGGVYENSQKEDNGRILDRYWITVI